MNDSSIVFMNHSEKAPHNRARHEKFFPTSAVESARSVDLSVCRRVGILVFPSVRAWKFGLVRLSDRRNSGWSVCQSVGIRFVCLLERVNSVCLSLRTSGGYSHVLLKGHLRLGLLQATYFISLLHFST